MFELVHDPEMDTVTVYKDGVEVGQCEAYELDAICEYLGVRYLEVDEDGNL